MSAIIDRDTGEVTWTDETFPDPKEYKERGIKVGELEAIDISMWDAYVEEQRCDAERNGNRFIAVSDEEIVVEETKPGALSVNRTIHRYNDETNTIALHPRRGVIDPDTGNVIDPDTKRIRWTEMKLDIYSPLTRFSFFSC